MPEGVDDPQRVFGLIAQLTAQLTGSEPLARRYRRTRTLWEGRYKSWLVDTERYLLTCYRYIELNPVRAAMVADSGNYAWSSYRANAQQGNRLDQRQQGRSWNDLVHLAKEPLVVRGLLLGLKTQRGKRALLHRRGASR